MSMMFYNPYVTPNSTRGGGRRMSVSTVSSQGYGGGFTATKRMTRKKRKIGQIKSLKRKIVDTLPAKHNTFDTSVAIQAASAYTVQPTRNIGQGPTNQDRLGDQIFLEALKLKGNFESPAGSDAYAYRIIVGFTGEETNGIASFVATGLTASEVYQPNTFNILINGHVNKKAVTVLLDETFDLNSQVEGAPTIHTFEYLIPIKQKFSYQSSGSTYGKTKNLFVWVVGYQPNAPSGTTVVGTIRLSSDLIFKD